MSLEKHTAMIDLTKVKLDFLKIPTSRILGLSLLIIIPLFILTFYQFIKASAVTLKFIQQDFEVFYLSGAQSLKGQNPYVQIGKDIVRNPPPSMLLFVLLPLLPIESSQTVWYVLSFLAFVLGSFFLFKTIDLIDRDLSVSTNWVVWLIYLCLVFIFFPFRYNLGSGQINNFLFLLITGGLYMIQIKKSFLSSILFAMAILLKITPIIFLFNLLMARKFRLLLYVPVNLIFISVLTGLIFNFRLFRDYLVIPSSFFDFNLSVYYNQSIVGVLSRIFKNSQITQMLYWLSLTIALTVLAYFKITYKKTRMDGYLIFWSISIIYILLFSPFSWQYHFVIIVIPLVITAYTGFKLGVSWLFYVGLVISYALTGWNVSNNQTYVNQGVWGAIILSNTFMGAFFLLILNFNLIKRLGEDKSI